MSKLLRHTISFFEELRASMPQGRTAGKKQVLRSVYERHKPNLSSRMHQFIEHGLLIGYPNPTYTKYSKTEEYRKVRSSWIKLFSYKQCNTCRQLIEHADCLFRVTPHDYCSGACSAQSETTRSKYKCTMTATYGVENASHSKEIRARAEQTNQIRHGMTSREIREAARVEFNSKHGISSSFQLASVKRKAEATVLERFGVTNAMQNPDVALKMLRNARNTHTVKLKGKTFTVQGTYEIKVLKALVRKYGVSEVSSQFSEEFPRQTLKGVSVIPDFYIHCTKTFVECKSTWTLMGRKGNHARGLMEGSLKRNKAKAAAISNAGFKVRWVVQGISDRLVLPANWFTFSNKDIRQVVTARFS